MLNTLERLQVEQVCDASAQTLGAAAKKKLGYSALADTVLLPKEAETLRELGLMPFVPAAVERYKAAMVRKSVGYSWWFNMLHVPCFLIAGLIFSTMFVFMFAGAPATYAPIMFLATFLWALSGIGFLAIPVKTAHWFKNSVKEYLRPVPEFAIQTALDVAARHPKAIFYIDELTVRDAVADPFLVVQFRAGGPYHYLEVWNEPGFKQERIA